MQKAKFQSINDDVSVSSNRTKRRSLKAGGGGNRAAWRTRIRSGPEGARGVLSVRGWSLCMLLSEVPSFRLSAFCCPSVGLFVPLTGAAGRPGFRAEFLKRLGRGLVFQFFFRIGFWTVF